jgi:hypothetical protein
MDTDIAMAGAPEISKERMKEDLSRSDTIVIDPMVVESLKEIGLTVEDLIKELEEL